MTRNSTAACRYFSLLTLIAVLFGAGTAVQASEIRVTTGPWPDSIPRPEMAEKKTSPPFYYPVDLTVVEDTLTIEVDEDYIVVLGEARNDSDRHVGSPRMEVATLDAEGELIDTSSSSMNGSAGLSYRGDFTESVGPGETALFSVTLAMHDGTPPETVLFKATGWTVGVPKTGAQELELVGEWEVESTGSSHRLTATVMNSSSEDVIGLRTVLALRDESGAILEVGSFSQRAERIAGYLGGVRAGGVTEVDAWFSMDPEIFSEAILETRLNALLMVDETHRYAVIGIAHQRGLGGSQWRSSLDIVNVSGSDGWAFLTYRYEGGSTLRTITLDKGEAWHVDDVAAGFFEIGGQSAGYLHIQSSVPLKISGRTSNERPEGGYGQALPVVTPGMTYGYGPGEGLEGVLPMLRGGNGFRTNIGLVNLADSSCSAWVVVLDTAGQVAENWGRIELEPKEWRQINRAVPSALETAYATVMPQPGCPIWAYASVIEEATGDPVTVELQRLTEIDLRPGPFGYALIYPWASD